MDKLNKVSTETDSVPKVDEDATQEEKGAEIVGDGDSDGSPRRFYHTVRVV